MQMLAKYSASSLDQVAGKTAGQFLANFELTNTVLETMLESYVNP